MNLLVSDPEFSTLITEVVVGFQGRDRETLQIGDWAVDLHLNQIRGQGEIRQLEPKVMRVLELLADRPGEVITREEFIQAAWHDVAVTDNVIARAVASLRKSLDDDWRQPRYIQTISKSGYRLIAQVSLAEALELNPEALDSTASLPGAPASTRSRRAIIIGGILMAAAAVALATLGRNPEIDRAREIARSSSLPVTSIPGR